MPAPAAACNPAAWMASSATTRNALIPSGDFWETLGSKVFRNLTYDNEAKSDACSYAVHQVKKQRRSMY
jgi:hypothetical protein